MVRISDIELLNELRENSRASFVNLARKFGVTETAIRKRVRKLEEQGTIKKYTIEVDPRKLGYGVSAVIGIDTKPESYMPVLEKLKDMKDVKYLRTSSGDHMILVDCWFRQPGELRAFVKKIDRMDGVVKACPSVITEELK